MTADWRADATCLQADPEAWFPELGEDWWTPVSICKNSCPVLAECREYALSRDEYGIWGGMTRRQRKQTRTAMARAAREEVAV